MKTIFMILSILLLGFNACSNQKGIEKNKETRVSRVIMCAERSAIDMGFSVKRSYCERPWLGRTGLLEEAHIEIMKGDTVILYSVYDFGSWEIMAKARHEKESVLNQPATYNYSVTWQAEAGVFIEMTAIPRSKEMQMSLSNFNRVHYEKMKTRCGFDVIGRNPGARPVPNKAR